MPSDSPSLDPTGSPTGSPSESPSGSYYPSTSPTGSPSDSPIPSESPSAGPTASVCEIFKVVDEVCYDNGFKINDPVTALSADSIIIKEKSDKVLKFVFNKDLYDDLTALAVLTDVGTCSLVDGDGLGSKSGIAPGSSSRSSSDDEHFIYEGVCIHGFASITVVAYYNDNFESDECDACNPIEGKNHFCSYDLEIPCSDDCSPSNNESSDESSGDSDSNSDSKPDSNSDSDSGHESSPNANILLLRH
jgi:hypothetical protein